MASSIVAEALKCDISERILIVEDIWDSIAESPEALPITDAQITELDKRLAEYHNNPESGSPWAEVKKRLRAE